MKKFRIVAAFVCTSIFFCFAAQGIFASPPGPNKKDFKGGGERSSAAGTKLPAVNILEAGTNHNAKGLGLLWQEEGAERTKLSAHDYQKMLFPAGKINSIKDYSNYRNAAYPFVMPTLPHDKWLLAMILLAIAFFIVVIKIQKKKRLILITGLAIVSMAALVSCPAVTNSAQIPDRRDLPFTPVPMILHLLPEGTPA